MQVGGVFKCHYNDLLQGKKFSTINDPFKGGEMTNKNFEWTKKSSMIPTKSLLRNRSIPLKGLKYMQKKTKYNGKPSKKKFLDQKNYT